MEGDFNVKGHLTSTRISCTDLFFFTSCGPRTIKLDIDVLPRRIENWTYSDDDNDWYDFHGTSPCGHMHFASLAN